MSLYSLLDAIPRPLRSLGRRGLQLATAVWDPRTRLVIVGDGSGWALDNDKRALRNLVEQLGIRTAPQILASTVQSQSVFYLHHVQGLSVARPGNDNRIGIAYYHGVPGTGHDAFDEAFELLKDRHEHVDRIQVTHETMRNVVLEAGVDPAKVYKIPIGIEIERFPPRTRERQRRAREAWNVPKDAFVVGSFQKDGVGWGSGREPKLIKGPDVLVDVLAAVDEAIDDLFVLLSGPARGYVKDHLDEFGIPYQHHYLEDSARVSELYQALDLYVVTSRQEGGPKMVLESMASKIPLITTRVGQATELIQHGQNGWLADVGDVEQLAALVRHVASHPDEAAQVAKRARGTAEAHCLDAQRAEWAAFFDGFVRMDG